jgi:hypothetical protein
MTTSELWLLTNEPPFAAQREHPVDGSIRVTLKHVKLSRVVHSRNPAPTHSACPRLRGPGSEGTNGLLAASASSTRWYSGPRYLAPALPAAGHSHPRSLEGPADARLGVSVGTGRFERSHIRNRCQRSVGRVQRRRRAQRAGVVVQDQRPFGLSSTCWLAQIRPFVLSARILVPARPRRAREMGAV